MMKADSAHCRVVQVSPLDPYVDPCMARARFQSFR